MKCIKCSCNNIIDANYCKKCGYHFSKEEQLMAKSKTLVGKLEILEETYAWVTLKKITGHTCSLIIYIRNKCLQKFVDFYEILS